MTSEEALKVMNNVSLFPYWNGECVQLICRDCDYTQNNAGPVGRMG